MTTANREKPNRTNTPNRKKQQTNKNDIKIHQENKGK
jgi:hypothetical protein